MTLFRRNNDVIIALCVRWDRTTLPLRPRLHYIKHSVHWLNCSGCWFHLGSAYLHIYTMNKNTIKEWMNTDTAGDGCSDVKIFQSQGSLAARDNDVPPGATPIGSHLERSHLGRWAVYMSVFGSTTRVTRVTPTTRTSLPNTKNQRKCCPS